MFSAPLTLPWWWYILPAYLTVWSFVFATWNFFDGAAMFKAFKIDFSITSTADAFIIKNSAARYLGITAALIVGVFLFRTPEAIVTALVARFVMDVFDLVAGLQTGLLEKPVTGIMQSVAMFLAPNAIALILMFSL